MIPLGPAIAGGAAILIVNILIWVFLFGKTIGRQNTRLCQLEENTRDPEILPECQKLFRTIEGRLGDIGGKVDFMVFTMNENKKNKEKSRQTRKKKSDT